MLIKENLKAYGIVIVRKEMLPYEIRLLESLSTKRKKVEAILWLMFRVRII